MRTFYLITFSFLLIVTSISCKREDQVKPTTEISEIHFKEGDDEDDPIIIRIVIGKTTPPSSSAIAELVNNQTNTVIATVVVDSDGNYLFNNVLSGHYTILIKVNGLVVDSLSVTV